MLAIGRCLMGEPRLILFDEPSLGLAPVVVEEMFRVIARLNREAGLTIVLVEQNVAQSAAPLAHRGYVLENGRIVARRHRRRAAGKRRRAAGLCGDLRAWRPRSIMKRHLLHFDATLLALQVCDGPYRRRKLRGVGPHEDPEC